MKKGIILATIVLTTFSSIFTISAETELVTDSEKIYDIVNGYVEENLSDDVTVMITEDGRIKVIYRKTSVDESEVDSDDLHKFLQENNVDFEKIMFKHLDASPYINFGDIDLNGTIDVTDLTDLSLALLGDKELKVAQKKAADIDGDGSVTLADLARLQQYISKKMDKLD
jgi:hypothetical protein